jgi:proline dehydrogenase
MTAERQRALETGTPSPVCDTIDQTHANYSHCVDLVLQSIAAGSSAQQQQHLQQQQLQQRQRAAAEVMVATHNQASVEHTLRRMRELQLVSNNNSTKSDAPKQSDVSSNVSSSGVSFGQLLGMSDHLSFPLGAHGYSVYKYLPYGKVSEVMPYLLRRAQENSSLLGGAVHERQLLAQEVKRRLLRR